MKEGPEVTGSGDQRTTSGITSSSDKVERGNIFLVGSVLFLKLFSAVISIRREKPQVPL